MTQLGATNDLFKKFQEFRDKIMSAQSVADISEIRIAMKPYIDKTPEEGGLKLDLRKILDNIFKVKEAELYGESLPKTDLNTNNISKDMQPGNAGSGTTVTETVQKETVPTKPQTNTGAQEVTLPPAQLAGRAQEIAKDMKDIDAENFKDSTPTLTATASVPTEPVPTPEKKTRSRTKPTEETTIEYIPRSQKSVKLFRRINVSINGIAYTNNEIGYEIIADTREEVLEEAKALRETSLADIRELNQLMKVQPTTQTTPLASSTPGKVHDPATPTPAIPASVPATVTQPTVTTKDASDVFGGFDLDKVMKAVAEKNPAGLEPGHEFDRYNLERLRSLFAILRSVDDVSVQTIDGGGMMLGTYITEQTKKFGAQFPVAK